MLEVRPFDFNPATHTFTQNGVVIPSVTEVLAANKICDLSFVDEDTRIYSMKRGQSVHWMLQLEDEGSLDHRRVPKAMRGYRKAYLAWKKASGFMPLYVERQFVYEQYGYAGIIDRAGTFPATQMCGHGTSGVVDLKTGAIPDWARYQLVAYAEWISTQVPIRPEYIRRIGLSLRADGTYRVREFALCSFESDWSRFIHALRKVKENGKRD